MFGMFRKRKAASRDIAKMVATLCQVQRELSDEVGNLYRNFPRVRRFEIDLFTLSATSILFQGFNDLSESELQKVIEELVDQCVASTLIYTRDPDFMLAHGAFVARFKEYEHLIMSALISKSSDNSKQYADSHHELIAAMDINFGIDRAAFEQALASLDFASILTASALVIGDISPKSRQ